VEWPLPFGHLNLDRVLATKLLALHSTTSRVVVKMS
jgi:hypothetical protein